MTNRRKRAVFRKSYKTNNREKQSLFLPVSDYSEERGNAESFREGRAEKMKCKKNKRYFRSEEEKV